MSIVPFASDLAGQLTQLYSETKRSATKAGDFTQFYTDVKKSAISNVSNDAPENTTPALAALHRKFRAQKIRLDHWEDEWRDGEKGSDGTIGGSIARAGLTQPVAEVLGNIRENINEIVKEAERIQSASTPPVSSGWIPEKSAWLFVDLPRYEDLIKQLTGSVELLYDLSRIRRALAAGNLPTFQPEPSRAPQSEKSQAKSVSFVEPETHDYTSRPRHASRWNGRPLAINASALILPDEGPPPYANAGVILTTRLIGRLDRSQAPEAVRLLLQESLDDPLVLVEFANSDSVYQTSNLPPPLSKLELLAGYTQQASDRPILNLIGYFEDPTTSRLGLIYDISDSIPHGSSAIGQESGPFEQGSLLHFLQTASQTSKAHEKLSSTPALEERFQLAFRVADQIRYMHSTGLTHDNLTSDSIVFVTAGNEQFGTTERIKSPVIGSFNLFARSPFQARADEPEPNIYRHPEDHGLEDDPAARLRYDVYGLGLVLLEIGLWTPLSDLYKAKYQLKDFKTRLEKIWIPRLAVKCGSIYMNAVKTCFEFSDSFGDTTAYEYSYVEVIKRLRNCCLLCDDHPSFMPLSRQSTSSSISDSDYSSQPNAWRSVLSVADSGYHSQSSARRSGAYSTSLTDISDSDWHDTQRPSQSWMQKLRHNSDRQIKKTESETFMSQDTDVGYFTKPQHRPSPLASPRASDTNPQSDPPLTHRPHSDSSATFHHIRDSLEHVLSPTESIKDTVRNILDEINFDKAEQNARTIQRTWREWVERRSRHAEFNVKAPDFDAPKVLSPISQQPFESLEPKERIFPCRLPAKLIAEWNTDLGMRIARVVDRALKDSTESTSINLINLGFDEQSSVPTILVTCTSTAKVKAAIKRRFRCDTNIYKVKVRKGAIVRSLSSAKAEKETDDRIPRIKRSTESGEEGRDWPAENPFHHPRPVCGSSIGAFHDDEGHLLAASLGGIVLIDDKPFGMSVHHMLIPPPANEYVEQYPVEPIEPDWEVEDESDSSAVSSFDSDTDSDDEEEVQISRRQPVSVSARRSHGRRSRTWPTAALRSSDVDSTAYDASNESEGFDEDEETDGSSSDIEFPDEPIEEYDYDEDLAARPPQGDRDPFPPSHEDTVRWTVTQPAFQDAFKPKKNDTRHQGEIDDEHLTRFRLGTLYASSGLRRHRKADGEQIEIDWALFQIGDDRLQSANLVLGGRQHCEPANVPSYQPHLSRPVLRDPIKDPRCLKNSSTNVRYPQALDLFPTQLTPVEEYAGLRVFGLGRTSGLATAMIAETKTPMKLYGRNDSIMAWTVISDKKQGHGIGDKAPPLGVGGDSGSWIIDCHGRIVGVVLAHNENKGYTYFCPMNEVLDDIRRTLSTHKYGSVGSTFTNDTILTLKHRVNVELPGQREVAAAVASGSGAAGLAHRFRRHTLERERHDEPGAIKKAVARTGSMVARTHVCA
ncbi:hypothetical protein ANO11243_003590 [Dothideomycetidae sp. 11243]|nr:hypothetical protein ANO11243_003590 [fungal sp. No.11243]